MFIIVLFCISIYNDNLVFYFIRTNNCFDKLPLSPDVDESYIDVSIYLLYLVLFLNVHVTSFNKMYAKIICRFNIFRQVH